MGCSCLGSNIFSSGAGKVVAVDGEAVPVHFAVDGDNNTFHDLKAIVTSVGLQSQGGFQFMHALREFIYLYVFTERVGEIVINGLAFPETCNFGPQGAQDDDSRCIHGQSGLERGTNVTASRPAPHRSASPSAPRFRTKPSSSHVRSTSLTRKRASPSSRCGLISCRSSATATTSASR
jgi:hypothetical protein